MGDTNDAVSPTSGDGRRPATPRRAVLAGVGAVGAAAVLAGCGTSPSGSSGGGGGNSGGSPTPAGGSGAGGSTALAKTSDIPVGGGKIFDQQNVVVTQPAAGQFKAFSATCTHQGCTVSSVSNGMINCPCHGSQYSITDGSVKNGPAPKPLPTKNVTVQGGEIMLS